MNTINDKETLLFNAILQLHNIEECKTLFNDLCTAKELETISSRLLIAYLLSEDKVYTDIVKETGASSATISRVNTQLQNSDGFDFVLDRLKRNNIL